MYLTHGHAGRVGARRADHVFDPWRSRLMAQDLRATGLKTEEIWQTGARRGGASASPFDLIIQQRLHYRTRSSSAMC